MKKDFDYECAIIGGGPGGLVSTLYLARYERKIVIVDAGRPRARWIPRIRNLIGYNEGLTGPELLAKLRAQVGAFHPDFIEGVADLRRIYGGFEVHIGHRKLTAKKVILATGMQDIQPNLHNLEDLRKTNLIGYCPICDGYEHRDDIVGLLVRDVHGLKKIKFMSNYSPNLHIIQEKKFEIPAFYKKQILNLKLKAHVGDLVEIHHKTEPRGLMIKQKGKKPFFINFLYVALGTDVSHLATRHIKGLKKTREGFLHTDSHQETSVQGLFAVGDCVNTLSQVSVAVGQAAIAATRVHNSLGFKEFRPGPKLEMSSAISEAF